ncbi:DUF1565 domain-containing protein [Actinosynnema sp. CA-248983]
MTAVAASTVTVLVPGAPAAQAEPAAGAGPLDIVPTSYPIPVGALFVAPTGDDANPGTQAAPLRTAAAAVGKAVAGRMTTVVFRAGEYRERLGTSPPR